MSKGWNSREFVFDLLRRHDMTVGHFSEIQFDARTKTPIQRHLVYGHHRVAFFIDRMEMIGRVKVGAVVGDQGNFPHDQPLPSGRSSGFRPGKNSHTISALSAPLRYSMCGRMISGSDTVSLSRVMEISIIFDGSCMGSSLLDLSIRPRQHNDVLRFSASRVKF
jgi:hypothetical protein